ncbi:probable LRR receptor-like serine/threonine-protein kinase At3g47570 [Neltuma alba]|uniref:probable LRR receptor-like serine/threonine-protein kinase At3g47570 n=1 Tax=Neltuma alba TaxID=207710 RepID=UPI0010A3C22F|nr:probable LRR receptor-like serine/threonine-protein kinase At3g47570 [Prosopis alba]
MVGLDNNHLKDNLPEEMCHDLPLLEVFGVDDNQLEGSIPNLISNCTSLKRLYLDGNSFTEYGSKGVVSAKGDVYSYGILLMEMFTRKKPTDEMFVQGLSLKDWVRKSTPYSIINIIDVNLLHRKNQNTDNILCHISSVFDLALKCCNDLPEARLTMIDVAVSLKNIKALLMENARDIIS